MKRQNVYAYAAEAADADQARARPRSVGWLDLDKATRYAEADGDAELYRAATGQWVSHMGAWWEYVSRDQARAWLERNGHQDGVVRLDAEAAAERAPGRPSTGESVKVNIPAVHLAELDALAEEGGTTRAALIRSAVALFLSEYYAAKAKESTDGNSTEKG